jgi:hypothetical protein
VHAISGNKFVMSLIFFCVPLTETNSNSEMHTQRVYGEGSSDINEQMLGLHSPSVEPEVHYNCGQSSMSQLSYINSLASTHIDSLRNASVVQERNNHNFGDDFETSTIECCNSFSTKMELVKYF